MLQKIFPAILIMYIAIMLGPFMFLCVILFLIGGIPTASADFTNPLTFVAIVLAITALTFAYVLYPNQVQKVKQKTDPISKLNSWKSLYLVRLAFVEGACLFCIIGLFLQETGFFFYLFIALYMIMLSFYPSKTKLQNELELSETEMTDV